MDKEMYYSTVDFAIHISQEYRGVCMAYGMVRLSAVYGVWRDCNSVDIISVSLLIERFSRIIKLLPNKHRFSLLYK